MTSTQGLKPFIFDIRRGFLKKRMRLLSAACMLASAALASGDIIVFPSGKHQNGYEDLLISSNYHSFGE